MKGGGFMDFVAEGRSYFHLDSGMIFLLLIKNIFYPVNIKITETTRADNLNCKLGIYYALTGKVPNFTNEIGWLDFFKKLEQDLGKEEDKDYYFLICNKNDTQDIFCTRLRGLKELVTNGSNLSFQCNWSKNREVSDRSFEEAKVYTYKAWRVYTKTFGNIF